MTAAASHPGDAWRIRPAVAALLGLGLAFMATRALAVTRRRPAERSATGSAPGLGRLMQQRTGELSALSTHLQQLAEQEKAKLARDLHEELGGLLTAAKIDLSWLQSRLAGQPAVLERLQQLGSVLDQAMDVKRRVVEDLRPTLLDHFGLEVALRSYFNAVCAEAGLGCEADIVIEEPIAPELAIGLFRIAQEGLSNIVRHSRARRVGLELKGEDGGYRLRLRDDGCGIDLDDPEFHLSYGLTGMRHRVWGLGGRIALESRPGRGTVLDIRLPGSAADSRSVRA